MLVTWWTWILLYIIFWLLYLQVSCVLTRCWQSPIYYITNIWNILKKHYLLIIKHLNKFNNHSMLILLPSLWNFSVKNLQILKEKEIHDLQVLQTDKRCFNVFNPWLLHYHEQYSSNEDETKSYHKNKL
jgi:hypothetical protein